MEIDIFSVLLSGWIFIVFGTMCVLSVLFTLYLPIYIRIEEALNFSIFSNRILTPLDRSVDWVNIWLMNHNKITGTALVLLSIVDLRLSFNVVNML